MGRSGRLTLYAFLLPAMLMLFAFVLLPALWSIRTSFTNLALSGVHAMQAQFVGLQNYARLFSSAEFYQSLCLSLEYTAITSAGQFAIGIIAALVLSRRRVRARGLMLAAILAPMAIPGLTQALIWSSVLAPKEFGTLNRLIGLVGLQPVSWLTRVPMLAVTLVNFWNNSGLAMILFLAGLENIPKELLEAAKIDGANGWQSLVRIKLPLIRYVILLWLLLNTLGCFGMFDLVFALTRGGPGNATQLIGIFVYNHGFRYYELGFGSAAAVVMLTISLLLALLYVRLMRVEV